jgi:leucyl/phenylalanyl-tRNA--protein transferase
MELAYRRLHELGYAHSCEAWGGNRLVGGVYGVCIGRMFYGESMFSHESNASKAALITLGHFLRQNGFDLMDAQLHTPHLESLGGRHIPREEFVRIVEERSARPAMPPSWADLGSGLPPAP